MKLTQANSISDWIKASDLLMRVSIRLESIGQALWNESQVSVAGLQRSYMLNELYFLHKRSDLVGIVFLQESDPYFWPDVTDKESLYVHKLAIEPSLVGAGYGRRAIDVIAKHAAGQGFKWIRLDCDDRPKLHDFYQGCGFEFINVRTLDSYRVARYRLTIKHGEPVLAEMA